ncbi:class I SAM-dependent methyltransferase [Pontibacter locisalis]|uniref:Class I SAM-dependent methyltransferase n=1 Tax=Pontibacter locisalis TaxID=1719035 RepID=A0ABW5IQC2_9BACT
MFDTPVLFLIFNRPDLTRQVFAKIREAKPKVLFVAADGPRFDKEGEAENCNLARKIATDIDWDCKVETLFRDVNLGCGRAVSEAISWFFNNVEQGIILEDDCLPTPSFFTFCDLMLNKFKDDKRIMMVSGFNHLGNWKTENADYFFSQLGSIWGWATWKRAWNLNMDSKSDWETALKQEVLKNIMWTDAQAFHRENVTDLTFRGVIDTWDYKWTFYRLANSGLSILPSKNLIINIGFGEDATHTITQDSKFDNLMTYNFNYSAFKEPEFVYVDREYDLQVFNKFTLSNPESQKGYYNLMKNNIAKYLKSASSKLLSRAPNSYMINEPQTEFFSKNITGQILTKFKQYIPHNSSSIDFLSLSLILNDIVINRRKSIVELGSGFSTIVIAKLIQINNLSCKFLSIEHDPEWIILQKELLKNEGLEGIVEIQLMPLISGWYCEKFIANINKSPGFIDCLIVDGPPAYSKEIEDSRRPALYKLNESLAVNSFILLHDTDRLGESEIIKSWENTFKLDFIDSGKSSYCIKGNGFNIR